MSHSAPKQKRGWMISSRRVLTPNETPEEKPRSHIGNNGSTAAVARARKLHVWIDNVGLLLVLVREMDNRQRALEMSVQSQNQLSDCSKSSLKNSRHATMSAVSSLDVLLLQRTNVLKRRHRKEHEQTGQINSFSLNFPWQLDNFFPSLSSITLSQRPVNTLTAGCATRVESRPVMKETRINRCSHFRGSLWTN